MKKRVKQLLSDANERVISYTATEAMTFLTDENVVFVDVREAAELERDGRIPGATHASRGILEFMVDPDSPRHNPIFASGKKFLFFSGSGERSALAAQRMQEMGMELVAHISNGLKGWKTSGGPVAEGRQNGE